MTSDEFRFTDPREKRIHERLKALGDAPAAFFRDAIALLRGDDPIESSTHLVGHLLREIEGYVLNILETVSGSTPEVLCEKCKRTLQADGKVKKITRALVMLELDKTSPVWIAWMRLSKEDGLALHKFAHRSALATVRPLDDDFNEVCELLCVVLDGVLAQLESVKGAYLPKLDELAEKATPSNDDLGILKKGVPNNAVFLSYFFERAKSPSWLPLLAKAGMFLTAPKPLVSADGAAVSFPPWPAATFLGRMAEQASSHRQLIEILLNVPDTGNEAVRCSVIDIALRLPPDMAVRLVPSVRAWIDAGRLILTPQSIGKLIELLAVGGELASAIELARALFVLTLPKAGDQSPLLHEPQPRFDSWTYREVLRSCVRPLAAGAGDSALLMLCDLLSDAVLARTNAEGAAEHRDLSVIWRPSIASSDRNHGGGALDSLVDALRDCANAVVGDDETRLEDVIRLLESPQWPLFRRVALHLLAQRPTMSRSMAVSRITDLAIFDDINLRHEYNELARARAAELSEVELQTILSRIEARPADLSEPSNGGAVGGQTPLPAEERELRLAVWTIGRLEPFHAVLPPDWLARFEHFKSCVSELPDGDFPYASASAVFVGPTSPMSVSDLNDRPVTRIVNYLREWVPARDILGGPSVEGLGRDLQRAVASQPDRFAVDAMKFANLDPTYIRSLIQGWDDAAKAGTPFDWDGVVALAEWACRQVDPPPTKENGHSDQDPDWSWCRKSVAWLLRTALARSTTPPAARLRQQIWSIIELLTNDPDPTPDYEAEYGGSNMGPATMSLNTVRGSALHCVAAYVRWVGIERTPDIGPSSVHSFELMPEVRDILNRRLDTTQEPSTSVRAAIAWHLPLYAHFDRAWVRDSLPKIFPVEADALPLWSAAFTAFVMHNRPDTTTFELLRPMYECAADRMGAVSGYPHNDDARLAFARHLILLCSWGLVTPEDPLFVRFFCNADAKLRAHLVALAGQMLRNPDKPIPSEVIGRMKSLWEHRILGSTEAPKADVAEYEQFGWWFVSDAFETDWALDQLGRAVSVAARITPDRMVIEKLKNLAGSRPHKVIDVIDRMVDGNREGWRVLSWADALMDIVITIRRLPDESARKRAIGLANRLVALGLLQFRKLALDEADGDSSSPRGPVAPDDLSS